MKISTKKYATALYEALSEPHGKTVDEVIGSFIQVLADKGLMDRAEKIIIDFSNYCDDIDGVLRVDAVSAQELDTSQEEKIKKQLQKSLGKKIELRKIIDKKIIGGLILRFDDTVVDGSLKTQLEIFEMQLKKF